MKSTEIESKLKEKLTAEFEKVQSVGTDEKRTQARRREIDSWMRTLSPFVSKLSVMPDDSVEKALENIEEGVVLLFRAIVETPDLKMYFADSSVLEKMVLGEKRQEGYAKNFADAWSKAVLESDKTFLLPKDASGGLTLTLTNFEEKMDKLKKSVDEKVSPAFEHGESRDSVPYVPF